MYNVHAHHEGIQVNADVTVLVHAYVHVSCERVYAFGEQAVAVH